MVIQQIHASNSSASYLIPQRPCLRGIPHPSFQLWSRPSSFPTQRKLKRVSHGCRNDVTKIKAVAVSEAEKKSVKVTATVSVQPTVGGIFSEMAIERGLDDIKDLLGQSLLLELVSAQLDPSKHTTFSLLNFYSYHLKQSSYFYGL